MPRTCFLFLATGVVLVLSPPGTVTEGMPSSPTAPERVVQQTPTFRTRVETVVVYATVADAGGRLVPDLPKDAFELLDNGQRVQVSVFSNEQQSITVALMLDMSNSMQVKVLRVRESALHFVAALQPGDRATIGTFGEEIAISPLLTGDKELLSRVLHEELWPGGFTPLWRAVDAAMTYLAKEAGRRVVLMLTDGADADLRKDGPLPADIERRAIRESFMVYAVGMEGKGLAPELARVAEQTGGGHFELASAADLSGTFARVVEELRNQYLLGFIPTVLDGKLHRVEVRTTQVGMKVRARKTYQARERR